MKTFQDFLKEVKKSAASRLLRIMKDKELIKNPPTMKRTEDSKEKNKEQGVAESSEQKFKVTVDHHGSNRDVPLYTKTYPVRASNEKEAIDTIRKLVGGRNHRVEQAVAEEVVAEGSGKNVVKSVKVGNFRHDLVDTGFGWQVRIYNGDELHDTSLSKNSEQKGLGALDDAVAYTKKQLNIKEQVVAEGGPFSYGTKKPRRGSIASNAAQKRKEQDKRYQPIEPQDQMVGVAKVLKKEEVVAEGSEGKTPGVALSKAYKKDFDDKKPGHNKPETALTGTYSKTGKPGGELKKQGVAESEKSPMFKDAQRADHIRSLKNLIAIAKEKGRQLRVQELELELKKLQGIAETSDYFRRREREEAIISGRKPARKRAPAQTSDYARRRQQEKNKEQVVAENIHKKKVKKTTKHVNDVFQGQGGTKTCPSCGSANIKQYSASDMQCNSCHAAWEPKKEVNKAIDKSHKKQVVAEGSEWETRHDEFTTVGHRATPEHINKIVSALGVAAKQASSKHGFLNKIFGRQSNGDLARMAHGAETLAKNIQRNRNAKPGTDERKELGQHLVYSASLLKRIKGKQGVAEETSDKSYTICKRCGGRGKVWKSTRDPKTVLPGNNQDKDTKRYTCGACKGVGIIKEEFVAEEKHRVQVTISDPNHVAVSKRKEQVQKHIRVSAEDKDSAVEKAKAYYNKAGYKVHSAEHVGMIKEESSACEKPVKEQAELIDELSRDLTQYRKKAALITSAADQAKKYDIGHSKFKGILKSTFKKIQKC